MRAFGQWRVWQRALASVAVLGALGLSVGCSCRTPSVARSSPRKVDAHVHAGPAAVPHLVRLMDAHGLDVAVNLSGGWLGAGLDESLAAAAATRGRVVVLANPPLGALRAGGPDAVTRMAAQLAEVKEKGAKGLKFFKSLGLGARWPDGTLVAVDDPSLDPLFERAGALGLPVAIHTADPVAFWDPVTPANERFDELSVHPDWSYAGKDVPSWTALYDAFLRRVARHPRTTFIGVHFGNAPEDPARVERALDAYPNLFVDTAARVPELGRHAPTLLRALLVKHPDRVLFGTDLGVGVEEFDLMLGSTGAERPTAADVERFFGATWRYFETTDVDFEHPTPIQGRWRISGLGLGRELLDRLYAANAVRVFALERTAPWGR